MLIDIEKAKLQAKHLGMTLEAFLARQEFLHKQAESLKKERHGAPNTKDPAA